MSVGLAIFVKTPGHSPVKTRLARTHGREFAEAWHRRAADTVAAVCRTAAGDARLEAYWAVAESSPEAATCWTGLPIVGQGEGGLGERMHHVHCELITRHHGGLLIGADTPQITTDQLTAAARWLGSPEPRCVLGPASDGGFWLFGANRQAPRQAWDQVRFSAPDTAERFHQAMRSVGAWLMLPTLTDADEAGDLAPLSDELRALAQPLPEQRALLDWMEATLPA